MPASTRRAAVIGGNRIPFARANGAYASASNLDMLTTTLDGLVARFGLAGERLGEVVAGAVLKHSRDFNLTREAVLGSRLSPATAAYDVQQACGTGLEATIAVANKIALGQIESGVAGGVDTASDAPIALNDDLRRILVKLNAAKTAVDRLKLVGRLRPGQIVPDIPENSEPRTGLSMGEHAARTALEWGIGRTEQDELAVRSHHNLAAAYDRGFFDDLVTPYLKLTRDDNLRPTSSVDKLAKLKPVFGKGPDATMTAGNSTPLTDGAALVLLGSDEWAHRHRLPVLAHVVDAETAGVDYVHGGGARGADHGNGGGADHRHGGGADRQYGRDGLLTAPVFAVPRLLERNGLSLQDFDLYEIHEAFASVVLVQRKAWEDARFAKERLGLDAPPGAIDDAKLNVTGSSLAVGHPFAATGGRIVATLAKLLREKADEERKDQRGLISICAAGGQGVVAILEAKA